MAGLIGRLDRLERRAGCGGPQGYVAGVNKPPEAAFDYEGFVQTLGELIEEGRLRPEDFGQLAEDGDGAT